MIPLSTHTMHDAHLSEERLFGLASCRIEAPEEEIHLENCSSCVGKLVEFVRKLIETGPDVPIVCTLTPEQFQVRRRTILDLVRTAIESDELSAGYVFTFKATSETVLQLAHLVELERQCCQFLSFKITVQPRQLVMLEVVGPPAAKPIIADLFGGL